MSLSVFYSVLSGLAPAALYEQRLQSFPAGMRESISRYALAQDRHLRIAGKCLLLQALEASGLYPGLSLEDYVQAPGQRPSLARTDISFSIAHSGDLVLCAVSREQRIGIDVEQVRPFRADLMASYFDPGSWQHIITAPDPAAAFYRHWTGREATLKASGQGIMQTEMADIRMEGNRVCFGTEIYYTRFLSLHDDYVVCIASEKEREEVELNSVEEQALL